MYPSREKAGGAARDGATRGALTVGFLAAPGAGARNPTTVVAPRAPLGRRSGERGNPAADEAKTVDSKQKTQKQKSNVNLVDGLVVRCRTKESWGNMSKRRKGIIPAVEILSDPVATAACNGLPIVKGDGPTPVAETGCDRAAK